MSQPVIPGHEWEPDWTPEGVPVSRRYADPFFSLQDGLSESRHVFIAGSDFPARFRPGLSVAELGFGTGLNLLALWEAWDRSGTPGHLHFTSFEIALLDPAHVCRALDAFPALADRRAALVAALEAGSLRFRLGPVDVELIPGDARETLPRWAGKADAWFLDGFAPARNPELWEPGLMSAVAGRSNAGATVATYSAAGHIRRGLAAAGFNVSRTGGFAGKRHMTRGRLS